MEPSGSALTSSISNEWSARPRQRIINASRGPERHCPHQHHQQVVVVTTTSTYQQGIKWTQAVLPSLAVSTRSGWGHHIDASRWNNASTMINAQTCMNASTRTKVSTRVKAPTRIKASTGIKASTKINASKRHQVDPSGSPLTSINKECSEQPHEQATS